VRDNLTLSIFLSLEIQLKITQDNFKRKNELGTDFTLGPMAHATLAAMVVG
jgi:hypothetical protein